MACIHCERDYSSWNTYSNFPNTYTPYTTLPALNGLTYSINNTYIRIDDQRFLILMQFHNTSTQTQKFYALLSGSTFGRLTSYDKLTQPLRTSVETISQGEL